MIEERFNKVSHYLALSNIGKNNTHPQASGFYLKEGEYKVSFVNYVKSQIHIDIVSMLFNRDIYKYINVYSFLTNGIENPSSLKEVLRYYYTDMANALINNKERLIIGIDATLPNVDKEVLYYSYKERSEELDKIIYEEDPYKQIKLLEECEYAEVFDKIDTIEEYSVKRHNFAIASVLLHESSNENINLIRIGDR